MTLEYRNALIVGKFYPPHRGHHHLIDQASQLAKRVSVVVMASGAETIPLTDRVSWIGHDHQGEAVQVTGVQCESPLDLNDANVWAAQIAAMRSALRIIDSGPIDLVVSGEEYGPQLARHFDADHHLIDRYQEAVSGTQVRADLPGSWDALTQITQAGLTCRVVVLGAESTGTTTIAQAVADHYRGLGGIWKRTQTVAEYGRTYTHQLWERQKDEAQASGQPTPSLIDLVWRPDDFDTIAARQTELENTAAGQGSPLLVCDTDAFATAIWKRRYLDPSTESFADWSQPPGLPRHCLYLLTSHDQVPWIDDGIREGDLAIRAAMTDWFADTLTTVGHPWVMLEGTLPERISLALRSIEPVLQRRLTLEDPLYGAGFPPPGSKERRR